MKLFDLFKKKKGSTQSDQVPTIHNEFNTPQKNNFQAEFENIENINPKFHRTEKEQDLSLQFSTNHFNEISNYENQLYDIVKLTNDFHLSINEQIENCKIAIKIWDEFKSFCYQTPSGKLYFQDMWEYCHNSSNQQFEYIQQVKERLEYLQNNPKEYLKKQQTHHEYEDAIDNSPKRILEIIKCNPGILQKDLKKFAINDGEAQAFRATCHKMESDGLITRVKKGNTYELYLK